MVEFSSQSLREPISGVLDAKQMRNWPGSPVSTFESVQLDVDLQRVVAVCVVDREEKLLFLARIELVDGESVEREVLQSVSFFLLSAPLQQVVELFDVPRTEYQFSGLIIGGYLDSEVVPPLQVFVVCRRERDGLRFGEEV